MDYWHTTAGNTPRLTLLPPTGQVATKFIQKCGQSTLRIWRVWLTLLRRWVTHNMAWKGAIRKSPDGKQLVSLQKWMTDAGKERDWCGCCGKGPGRWSTAVIPPQGAKFMEFILFTGQWGKERGVKHDILMAIFLKQKNILMSLITTKILDLLT